MQFRLGEYVMQLPPGARIAPFVMAPRTLADDDGRSWRMASGSDVWFINLFPGGTLDDLKQSVLIQTRLEIEPEALSLNGIPGVRHAGHGDGVTRVTWHFLKGPDLIGFTLYANATLTRADVADRASWLQSLRYGATGNGPAI